MHVYLSTSPNGDVFSKQWTSGWRKDQDQDLPNFVWENLTFGDFKASRVVDLNVKFPQVKTSSSLEFWKCSKDGGFQSVLNNGSLWADIFLTKEGSSPNPQSSSFEPENIHHVRKRQSWSICIFNSDPTFNKFYSFSSDPISCEAQDSQGEESLKWFR